jgi:hypothetical protein
MILLVCCPGCNGPLSYAHIGSGGYEWLKVPLLFVIFVLSMLLVSPVTWVLPGP